MMEQLKTLFARLETMLGLQGPYLKLAFEVILALIIFFVAWLILRQVLSLIEKRMKKTNLIEIQIPLLKIIRKMLFYALVLLAGTYFIRLFNIPLLGKIFHALI
ncbi:MAG: hypothetical protein PVF60_09765, partial [Desulfobacterales bacterium]